MQKCFVHLCKSVVNLYFFNLFLVAVEDPTLQEMAEYMEVNRLKIHMLWFNNIYL